MLKNATYIDDLVFLAIREKTDPAQLLNSRSIGFFFAIVYPDNKIPLRIQYINASLSRDGLKNGDPKMIPEKD